MAERTGNIGFPAAARTGQQQVLGFVDPVALHVKRR